MKNLVREEEGESKAETFSGYTEMLSLLDGLSPGEQLRILKDKIKKCSKPTALSQANILKEFTLKLPKTEITFVSDDFKDKVLQLDLTGLAFDSKMQIKTHH